MLFLPLLLAVALQSPSASGLRPDESLVALAPQSAPAAEAETSGVLRHGRIIDAFTGRPVAGAIVETWTEEITSATLGFRRIGEASTRASGQFTIRVGEGGLLADKARVRAAGYATLSTVPGFFSEPLALFPLGEQTPKIRFVDSAGRPIRDARITSTRTCAHDLPAFTLFPDATGTVLLSEVALQDENVDLRFLAPGYLGTKYYNTQDLFREDALDDGVLELTLPRAPHPRIRLVDRAGAPLSQQLLFTLDDGDHMIVRTDEEGVAQFPGRLASGPIDLQRLTLDGNRPLGEADSWMTAADRVFLIREDADDWKELADAPSRIRVRLPEDLGLERPPSFALYHTQDGWLDWLGSRSEPAWESSFPSGRILLGWGEAFGELIPGFMELELLPGELVEATPTLERAIAVTCLYPEAVSHLWFEVDGLGATRPPRSSPLWIPPGRAWRCGFQVNGRSFVRELTPVDSATTLDFRELLPPPAEPRWTAVQLQLPPDIPRDEIECSSAKVAAWRGEQPEPLANDQGWVFRGPAGHQAIVWLSAPGYLDRAVRIRFPTAGSASPELVPVTLTGSAALDLELPSGWTVIQGPGPRATLPPGPTELVLSDSVGRRYGLILNLEEGESRRVAIRAR